MIYINHPIFWLFICVSLLAVKSILYPFLRSFFSKKNKQEPVFCYDCKHCLREENGDLEFARCKISSKRKLDFLVNGPNNSYRKQLEYCSCCRIGFSCSKNCGKAGYHFEPKGDSK